MNHVFKQFFVYLLFYCFVSFLFQKCVYDSINVNHGSEPSALVCRTIEQEQKYAKYQLVDNFVNIT